jgi:hypothetical protein
MARPITPEKPVSASNEVDKRLEELEKLEADNQYDRYEQEAMHDFSMLGNLQ